MGETTAFPENQIASKEIGYGSRTLTSRWHQGARTRALVLVERVHFSQSLSLDGLPRSLSGELFACCLCVCRRTHVGTALKGFDKRRGGPSVFQSFFGGGIK